MLCNATDCHTNRTDNPSGFFNYNAELDDVLVPHHPPLRPILDDLTDNKIRLQQEAWSYIGISTTLLLFVLITLRILQVFRTKSSQFLQSVTANYFLNIFKLLYIPAKEVLLDINACSNNTGLIF